MNDLRKAAEMALEALEEYTCVVQSGTDPNKWHEVIDGGAPARKAIQALRQALAHEALDRVVAENQRLGLYDDGPAVKTYAGGKPNYCTPVDNLDMSEKRVHKTEKFIHEWVGLTDEEIIKCFDSVAFGQVEDDLIINKHVNIFRAIHYIEAKLKEKNNG